MWGGVNMTSLVAVGQKAGSASSQEGSNGLNALPYDCLAKISTFLSVNDTVHLASVSRKRLQDFPGTLGAKSRELALQFFLESRTGTERALLSAIDKDKLDVVSVLLLRKADISAKVAVEAIRNMQKRDRETVQWYYQIVLATLPQYQLFINTPLLPREQDVVAFVVPLLRLSIADDWLGQTLIQTSKNPQMNAAAKKMAIALLLEKQGISKEDVGRAFLDMAKLQFDPSNEEILMSFLQKRPDMSLYCRGVGIVQTAMQGYRQVVAALANSLGYDSHCQIAFVSAAEFGHREIITDFLANRLRLEPSLRQIGQAAAEAAEQGHTDVVRELLESTDNLPTEEVDRAIAAATRKGHFDIVQLLEVYRG